MHQKTDLRCPEVAQIDSLIFNQNKQQRIKAKPIFWVCRQQLCDVLSETSEEWDKTLTAFWKEQSVMLEMMEVMAVWNKLSSFPEKKQNNWPRNILSKLFWYYGLRSGCN